MPELPEVETTRRGIDPFLREQRITRVIVRERRLRWPISEQVSHLQGRRILDLSRRGKYLLMRLDRGNLIWHLGMTGSMKILPVGSAPETHEHVEMQMANGHALKFRDPRRFGACLYTEQDPLQHRLLLNLGPEPLGDAFDADYLYRKCRNRSAAIKTVIMNSHIVAGVGNIYASEALFLAGIRPTRPAGRISRPRISKLVTSIQQILMAAIEQGGTTLRDFTQADGNPGYFSQSLMVYGNRESCRVCGKKIKHIVQGQRTSYYCPGCQT